MNRPMDAAMGYGWRWGWGLAVCLALLASAHAQIVSLSTGLAVGLEQVPVAPVAGAKVRTPARIETLLMQASASGYPLEQVPASAAVSRVMAGVEGVWLGVLPATQSLPSGLSRTTLNWSASPMAIMRTDTTIHAWSDLKGRGVCLAVDGRYEGELALRFGAVERVYPSATDALLALRTGQCDATVQDESFLRNLLKFPEWHKFSASLGPYRHDDLVVLMSTRVPAREKALVIQATGPARVQALAKQQARDIAFEVYLDQAVPDCH
ncbi:MAG TPA: transporter substrate-binding domain-containing protein [Castellaniella sp.]|uniref:transporter substrate-binding domain-containing protein n=1 Tax=Castellaniella sp. TaxID=1955812 RepID=UPI002EF15B3C